MNILLEKALEAVRKLPSDDQEDIARVMLTLAAGIDGPDAVAAEHLPDVLESLAQMRRNEFATEAEVEAAFRRFGS